MPDAEVLAKVGAEFNADGFDWKKLQSQQLFYKCQPSEGVTCGKLLGHCKQKVIGLRESIGIRVCCFKIGITANPPQRFALYAEQNFTCMWVIASSKSVDTINMLEAALISEYHQHVGCKNEPGTGGEGGLLRNNRAMPPYFLYVTAGRADQPRWVG